MPDYDFSGLWARSFEHLVQALSCKILGPGLLVFGEGPDGGREATFTGKTGNFPSAVECWDGYVVIQAKFCQRPSGNTGKDGQWALKELKNELDLFVADGSERKMPDYYIFVTNVVLSPKSKKGQKDKVTNLISQYQERLGMKDFRVWDFDQLCRFLDADESVRNSYKVWITPGDVFARLASSLESTYPDFKKVMVNFLQKELLNDHYSKLEQGGHSPENRVPLEKVFVDLPVFDERRSEAPEESEEGKKLLPGFLSQILQVSSYCLKSDSFSSKRGEKNPSRSEHRIKPEPGRYVLIGGPGQGKSTLAQFLCQTHRAQLLYAETSLDFDANKVVTSIKKQCNSQGIDLNLARRFPIRIELAQFAKALAMEGQGSASSLLSYVAKLIKERSDYEVSVDQLRVWLHEYPWLVILDGLDEVPASSNRAQVLEATKDFLIDIATCGADVLLIATTRPQGYNAEFAPGRYHYLWLSPLSIPRALHYGESLLDNTYWRDVNRKKEVLSRLQDAAKVEATARLMESPLQVTIMARLLAQIAKPPQERYKLFQQYYKVIYRREMERGVAELSQLLRDYETDIDVIHYRTGLLLQVESERTKHTDATLSVDDFSEIVRHRLDKEGHSKLERQKMTDAIVKCATERLVFLVPTQSERVGFEVRSLQEFMASEALMDGGDKVVTSRIKKIAAVPYWQNVLLFAAGKCFAERQWLRDSVSEICGEMNDDPSDPLGHTVLTGSQLALSLLEDGPARRQPAYSHSLARRALRLLTLSPNEVHDRLADVYEKDFEAVYKEEIQLRMNLQNIYAKLSSWRVLLRLLNKSQVTWAAELAQNCWPKDLEEQKQIIEELNPLENSWLMEKYQAKLFHLPFLLDVQDIFGRGGDFFKQIKPETLGDVGALMRMELGFFYGDDLVDFNLLTISIAHDFKIRLIASTIDEARKNLERFAEKSSEHSYWLLLFEAARFVEQPGSKSLADTLERIAERAPNDDLELGYIETLPWPIVACINTAQNSKDLFSLASRVREGELGDISDWIAAEKRWKQKGLVIDDFRYINDAQNPIGSDIAHKGFPFICGELVGQANEISIRGIIEFWDQVRDLEIRSLFAQQFFSFFFHRASRSSKKWEEMSVVRIKHFLDEVIDSLKVVKYYPFTSLLPIKNIYNDLKEMVKMLDALGRKVDIMTDITHDPSFFVRDRDPHPHDILDLTVVLTDALEENPQLYGVLKLLAMIALKGKIGRIPSNLKAFRENEDYEVALCGLLLSLCQKETITNDRKRLVDSLLGQWKNDSRALDQFISCSVKHLLNESDAPTFFLHFWDSVGEVNVSVRQRVYEILTSFLARRVTGLQEQDVWKDLALPDGLHGVISI